MFTVTVQGKNGETAFTVRQDSKSLLDSARASGVRIPYACKGGGCGLCKIQVISGDYELGKSSIAVLPAEERKQGYALACKTIPKSDMKVAFG